VAAFSQIWATVVPHLQALEQQPKSGLIVASGIKLWLLPLNNLPVDASWLALLSEPEQQRAQRYANTTLSQDFIARRVVLRLLLAEVLQQPATSMVISSNPSGQPYLEGFNWHFSLSHSGRVALYGVARQRLGVDIEQLRAPKALTRISARYFPGEQIDSADDFFAAWTRFEARAKAAGQGIAGYTSQPGPSRDWPCENIDTLAGFAAALCWQP
jgi:4'-phosphopantetheinyl transferase